MRSNVTSGNIYSHLQGPVVCLCVCVQPDVISESLEPHIFCSVMVRGLFGELKWKHFMKHTDLFLNRRGYFCARRRSGHVNLPAAVSVQRKHPD